MNKQTIESIDTLVIGAGQAGIAMSEHLTHHGIKHIVLERDRIAQRWRTGRWDSLVANGPAWHDRFPNLEFEGVDGDGFPTKDQVVNYFVDYAEKFKAPVREGVSVTKVCRKLNQPGFLVTTSTGLIDAQSVVAATGSFQIPVIPSIAPKNADLYQLHSADYRNPKQLPKGGVLLIGAGSSGAQIAAELQQSGKTVYLSVGPHERPPRSYRKRDFVWWLGVLGKWDISAAAPGTQHVTIAVSGAKGGHTVDFRELAHQGVILTGRTQSFEDDKVIFDQDLASNIALGDAYYSQLLDEADAYVVRNGLDLPEDPDARIRMKDPDCLINPLREINYVEAGISSIIWATGYVADYSWMQVNAFDDKGKPQHQRGVSTEPGVYFVGLPWQSRRGSSFIWGVWHDAKHVADHIATQHKYVAYRDRSL